MEVPLSIGEVRLNHPAQIDCPNADDHDTERNHKAWSAFESSREQQGEWDRKFKKNQELCEVLPPTIDPIQVPGDFFSKIPRPDDQPLREREIRIKHGKGQHQLAEIMQFSLAQDSANWFLASQEHDGNDGDGECR